MSTVDPTTLAPSVLRDALLVGAWGLYREEAAVGLLLAHDVWFRRGDFLRSCVDVHGDGSGPHDRAAAFASVNWDAARELATTGPASSSEAAILRLAAALADEETGALLARLDVTNLALVLDAVAHCAGWHERWAAHEVTGVFWPADGGAS